MGELPLIVRLRQWLALDVLLPMLWFVLGSKPLLCDCADSECPVFVKEATDD